MNEAASSLPAETRLDKYIVDRTLGGGGFSLVYLAHPTAGGDPVVLKEYFPRRLAERAEDGHAVRRRDEQCAEPFSQGQRLFFREASILATVDHPNIVHVFGFFRANGTVYMAMSYEPGINLQNYIKRHRGSLSESFLRTVFPPLLDGLKELHAMGLLHLDIKPGNIHLRPGGDPVLLDFGAVHRMQQTRQYQASQVVTPGFAPLEQSESGGYVGPWSDLYALGATMRACIEGAPPPPAEQRRFDDPMKPAAVQFRRRYSAALLEAIDWAMEVDPLSRPQSVDDLLAALGPGEQEAQSGGSMLGRLANSLRWSRG